MKEGAADSIQGKMMHLDDFRLITEPLGVSILKEGARGAI
jgi:hypothetical protein